MQSSGLGGDFCGKVGRIGEESDENLDFISSNQVLSLKRGECESSETRQKVVTFGEMDHRQCNILSIVLSDGWPSWSYVLSSLGWNNQIILVRHLVFPYELLLLNS